MHELPRKRPCASCPYRRDVPSGVWAESQYDLLPNYDGDIGQQIEAGAFQVFGCHQADGHLCAGWVGHREPNDLLALRLAISDGAVDPAVMDYTTDVALFPSGAETAEHGKADIDAPGDKANDIIRKILAHVPGVTLGE